MADLAPKLGSSLSIRQPVVDPLPAGYQIASSGLGLLGTLASRKEALSKAPPKASVTELKRKDKERFYSSLDAGVQLIEQGKTRQGNQVITRAYRDFVKTYGREEEDVNNAYADATGFSSDVEVTGSAVREGDIASTPEFNASLVLAASQNPDATEDQLYDIAMREHRNRMATEQELNDIYQQEKVDWFKAERTFVDKAQQAGDLITSSLNQAQEDSIITPDEAKEIRGMWDSYFGALRKPVGVDQARWDKFQEEYIDPLNATVDGAIGLGLNGNLTKDMTRALSGIVSKAVAQGKLPPRVMAAFTMDKDGTWDSVMNILREENASDGRWSAGFQMLDTATFDELINWVTEYENKSSLDDLNLDTQPYEDLADEEKLTSIIDGSAGISATLNDPGKTAAYLHSVNQSFASLSGKAVTVTAFDRVFSPDYFSALKVAYEANPVIGEQLIRGAIQAINSQRVAISGAIQSTARQAGLEVVGGDVRPTEETLAKIQPTLDLYFNGDWDTAVKQGGKNSDGVLIGPVFGLIKAARDEVLPRMQKMNAANTKIDTLMEGLPEQATRQVTPIDQGGVDQPSNPIVVPTAVQNDTAFIEEVDSLASDLGMPSEWVMRVIAKESGFNPSIENVMGSGATGLIQFMPSTARDLGTTVEALKGMNRAEQMQYVRKYLMPKLSSVENPTFADLYMSILWPKAVGKSDNYILFKKGTKAYEQNSTLDLDKDGFVRKGEAAQWAWGDDTLPYNEGTPPEASAVETSARPVERPSDLETGTVAQPQSQSASVGSVEVPSGSTPTETIPTATEGASQSVSEGATASQVATERLERATLQQLRDSGGSIKEEYTSVEEFSTALENGEVEAGDLVLVEGIPMMVKPDMESK